VLGLAVVALRAVDQAVLVGVPRGLGAVLDVELAIDVRQMELHGLLRDPELLADRLVREAARDRRQNRRLALVALSSRAGRPR